MKLIYTAGTARGGTNYRTLILKNHSKISMSIDPLIPLFHYYKKSLIIHSGKSNLLSNNFANVLDDYFFDFKRIEIMKTLQKSKPDIHFDIKPAPIPIIISLLIKFFLKYLFNSISFLTIIT